MTVTNTDRKDVFVGDGATLIFAYGFRIFEAAGINVTIQDTSVSPQTEITLVLNTDYTLSGVGDPGGGNVTILLTGQLSSAPSATDNITLIGDTARTQNLDLITNDDFPSQSQEDAFDKLTFIVQEIEEEVDRSMKLAVNITGVSVLLPTPEADAPIGWNAAADALVNNPSNTNLSQIDSAATPDFLGATGGDGVLRSANPITYVDGGDFFTGVIMHI